METLEELKAKKINEDQPVKPAAFHPLTREGKWVKQDGRPVVSILTIFAIGFIGILIYNSHRTISPMDYSAQTAYIDPEHANPAQFILATGTYHPNFWGNNELIGGTVTNLAHHTNYKDIQIKVSFLSQTNAIVSSKEYIVHEFLPCGSTKTFSINIDKPAAAVACGWTSVGGTYY
jgi:hypothetical protein